MFDKQDGLKKEQFSRREFVKLMGAGAISYRDAAKILSQRIGREISYQNISEDDTRKGIKEMGINDWHVNILLELLQLSKDGYLSNITNDVEKVTGNRPIPFSQFANDYALALK